MTRKFTRLAVFVAGVMWAVPAPAWAQGAASTTSISGIVKDADGGVLPGATVTVVNVATKVSQATVTNGQGLYSLPNMNVGTYTVTVEMSGFKKVTHTDVRLLGNQPAHITTTLQIGGLTEEVTVSTPTDLVRIESPTVSSTVSGEFIKSVPARSRNALDFLVFLPGVETSGTNARGSTISGLPQNTINITIDGVSTSNNLQSGDGFFTMVTPRLDAVEEVTLTTANAGADSSAQGATQVRFVTKSGTNSYRGTAYEYFQHKSLNSNTFFNRLNGLPRPQATVDTFGASFGGPIVIPKVVDGRGKAFFFFNEEISWTPNQVARTRRVLRENSARGLFTYNVNNPTTVDMLALAARNGQISAMDPTVASLLQAIDTASKSTGTFNDNANNLNYLNYNYFVNVASTRNSPTTRIDVNLSTRHRLTGTYYLQRYKDSPDTLNNAESTFPGFPAWAHQNSYRTTGSSTLRSTLNANVVNEVLFGWQSSPNDFFGNSSPEMFTNQNGYFLNFGFPVQPNNVPTLTNPAPGNSNNPQPRNTPNFNIDNNLNWLKGSHSFKFGGSFTRISNTITNWTTVQQINLGFNTTNDPAAGLFNTTNFPGASTNDLSNARALYAMLTGRVNSIAGTGRMNEAGTEYVYNGRLTQAERMDEFGIYASDSWRVKPNMTLTLGVRYELQLPMVPTKSTRTIASLESLCGPSGLGDGVGGRPCNLFNPGVFNAPGMPTTYEQYSAETKGYNTDLNNFAPNVGITYRPTVTDGFWRKVLGDPDQAVLSSGYTRAFNRERVDRFTGVYGGNPGSTTPATRGTGATNFPLVPAGESWPLLFSQTNRLGPPDFQKTPTFPIIAATNNNVRIFDANIQVPYTDSWSVGFQRALTANTAVEVRYIGNRNWKPWTNENYNTANWIENGLIDEYKVAQANLLANVQAGRGGTFAYFGSGTGTQPLPIFLAHFTGSRDAGNAANYTTAAFANAAQFTDSTWVSALDPQFPDPRGIASDLYNDNNAAWRANGRAAGYATNFFVMNPNVAEATVMTNAGGSRYHSMQVDLRRRYSKGLQVQGSYTYARRYDLTNLDLHYEREWRKGTAIPHKFALLWVWDVPVGRGKRYGTDVNPWIDGVIGGWQFAGGGRVQQPVFRLTNTQLVGMSHAEAQKLFSKVRIEVDPVTGGTTVWNFPADVVTNTNRAYDGRDITQPGGYPAGETPRDRYFAPASSLNCMALFFNDCAEDLFFKGNWFAEFDFKFVKKFPISGRVNFDLNIEVYNAFTAKNFNQVINPNDGEDTFRITSTASGARRGQLVFRINF